MSNPNSNLTALDESGRNWLEVVRNHVESLRFGTVDITIQDGRVIQIEKTERLRFTKSADAPKPGTTTKDRPQA